VITSKPVKIRAKRRILFYDIGMWFFAIFISMLGFSEGLGQLKLNDLVIQPQGVTTNNDDGALSLGPSYVEFLWEAPERELSAFLVYGNDLDKPSRFFAESATSEVDAFAEAYVKYDKAPVTLKFGKMRIPLGMLGEYKESEWYSHSSYTQDFRWAPERDFAVSFGVDHNGFLSELMAFNADKSNSDKRLWFVGRWQNYGSDGSFGLTGISGRVAPDGTSGFSAEEANSYLNTYWLPSFESNEEYTFRSYSVFASLKKPNYRVLIEYFLGDMLNSDDSLKKEFSAFIAYTEWNFSSLHSIGLNFQRLTPDLIGEPDQQQYVAGINYKFFYGYSKSHFGFNLEEFKSNRDEIDVSESRFVVYYRITPDVRGK
jgi:hypothetical protein